MLQTSTLQGCVSRSNDQSNILFFFPTRFLQATCLGPSYSNPQERWTCVFLTYLMGFCLTRAFFWVQQIQQMSLQERSGLESLHLRKSQKLRPGSHASSASPAASVARTTATHRIPLFFFFHSRQMAIVLSLESGSGMVLDHSEKGTDVAMF